MKKTNKNIIIDSEMVSSVKGMFTSVDPKDAKLAWKILENRNKEDINSEANFGLIKEHILKIAKISKDSFNLAIGEAWVIKYEDKFIKPKTKTVFHSKQSASSSLTNSLRSIKYNKELMNIFGNHIKFKNFLVENKIVEFVNLRNNASS